MMVMNGGSLLFLLALVTFQIYGAHGKNLLTRKSFPEGFLFGAGSAAYQIEGATNKDGRGVSIWDTFIKQYPEKIEDRSNADVATDFYHRYKSDIKQMKEIGLDVFKFSISWPRILPRGRVSGGVSQLGIKFYNDLINELLANGIMPSIVIFHWDLPQALEDEYGGFLSPKIVEDFRDFANLCFQKFGDRVKHWATINEPNIVTMNGYDYGRFAPGRCSSYMGSCNAGNSATEPYIVAHHFLLCHAATVNLYRQKYQDSQKGKIGIIIAATWMVPVDETLSNKMAASRAFDFLFGWFADPVINGDYPKVMRDIVGSRLPKFTEEESSMLRHSFDYLGVNYYTSNYAADIPHSNSVNMSYSYDSRANLTLSYNGTRLGEPTPVFWIYMYPKGLRDLLLYIKKRYNNPPIIITENGVGDDNNSSLPIEKALEDNLRIRYIKGHLAYLHKAIKKCANVHGYFVWSYMDDFEWTSGYLDRFGFIFIDFQNGLRRYPKQSAWWFKKFLAS